MYDGDIKRTLSLILGARFFGVLLTTYWVAACGSGSPTEPGADPGPPVGDPVPVTVDAGTPLQTVDGFGSTTISLIYQGRGDYLGSLRSEAIEAVYGEVQMSDGLLSIGLFETPGGATEPYASRRNDNSDPTVIDPAGFDPTDMNEMCQQVYQPAASHGYDRVTLGPLLNMRNPLDWMQSIRGEDYQLFLSEAAEFVEAVVGHWIDLCGVRPDLLELFNEPTSGNRELSTSSAQEVVDLVKAVGARLEAAGYGDIPFLVPNEESMSRTYQVAQAILSDAEARQYVGAIGYHPYPEGSAYTDVDRILSASGQGSPNADAVQDMEALKELGAQYGVPVWMTEGTEGPGNASYPFGSMETVLARAIHIHDNFEYAGASAYFGMLTLWDSRSHEEHFSGRNIPFRGEQSGIALVDLDTNEVLITGMGYAIGHYARWIEPGSTRLTTSSGDERILVSGFLSSAGNEIVLVAVNMHDDTKAIDISLEGATRTGAGSGEVSYGAVRWEPISATSAGTEDAIRVDLPARSVATFAVPVG